MTRRQALSLLALTSLPGRAQQNRGMASRGLKPMPFGKPSGRPWEARFVNVAQPAGLRSPVIYGPTDHNDYVVESMGCGAAFLDYDNDGWQDIVLLTGRRLQATPPGAIIRLYRNNRDGTFTDVSRQSGISAVKAGYALTAIAADFDGDGWPDIYVACDTSPSLLFHNNGDGTFTEQGLESGVSLSEDGQEQAGMGVATGDFDTDGHLDIFKTHFRGDTSVLYRNNGKGYFRDVTIRAGLGVETRYVCWGAGIVDLDNDGLPDLFFTTGMVYPEVEQKSPDAPYKTPSVIFRNLGEGKFEELRDMAGPGIAESHCSRGVAFGDFDNDGDIDILVVNLNEPPSLLRNDVSGTNHWLKVLLIGVASNRSAIGAQVVAAYGERRQAQAVVAQSSYLSVNDRRLHFGLGSAATASLEIRWPSGAVEKIAEVAAGQLVVIREGSV